MLALAALTAGCTGSAAGSGGLGAPTPATSAASASGAVTTGLPSHVLWQVPLASPAVVGDSVVGWQTRVDAQVSVLSVDAGSGRTRWTYSVPAKGLVLRFLSDPSVVVAETGLVVGTRPAMPVVTRLAALDAGSGRLLWSTPVTGQTQSPPVVLSAGLLISGDPTGTVTARREDTGAVVWREPRPSSCPARPQGSYDEGLAADGNLLVTSYQCAGGTVLVQRLAPSSGSVSWRWQSAPAPASAFVELQASAAATAGSVAVLSGQVGPPPFTARFYGALPHPYEWPSTLGPDGAVDSVLALDAGTGKPRWSEVGAQQADLILVSGRTCAVVTLGYECRDDASGAVGAGAFATGNSGEPPSGDGHAGLVGDFAYVVLGPVAPRQVTIATVDVATGQVRHRTSVSVRTTPAGGAVESMFVQGAMRLSDGRVVALMQRVDDAAVPLMAVLVS